MFNFKNTKIVFSYLKICFKFLSDENIKKEQEELEKQLSLMEIKQKEEEEKCRQENTK